MRTLTSGLALTVFALCGSAESHAANVSCDVAIVGGGPGGVHTAYKLATQHLTAGPVCLFEKNDHLGGRIGDNFKVGFAGKPFVKNGVTVANSGQTGTGGYRMYFNQYTYKLGQELAALGQPGQLTFLSQTSFNNGGVAKASPDLSQGVHREPERRAQDPRDPVHGPQARLVQPQAGSPGRRDHQ
ncbi:MAG: FAD-dependent oxidoreductase [Myxococcales bacterium]|nr:FAD-dependent oxidoreductase [Myxococcales bacterium]